MHLSKIEEMQLHQKIHIHVIKSKRSKFLCVSYKHFFVVELLNIADYNYEFIYADLSSYGKDSDFIIFKNSSLWKISERNDLNNSSPIQGNKISAIDVTFCFC